MGVRKAKKIEDVQIYVQQECLDIYISVPRRKNLLTPIPYKYKNVDFTYITTILQNDQRRVHKL